MTEQSIDHTNNMINNDSCGNIDIHPQLQQVYEILQTQNDKIKQLEHDNQLLQQQLHTIQMNNNNINMNQNSSNIQTNQVEPSSNNDNHPIGTIHQLTSDSSSPLSVWKSRVASEHHIIQQLYSFLKSQKQTLRDIVTELQYQQNKWKNDKLKSIQKLKSQQYTTDHMKSIINQLNQRKYELDNSTDALNNDIQQLKSIKQWCIQKENILNQLDQNVTRLMSDMNNHTDALNTIELHWNQYITQQRADHTPQLNNNVSSGTSAQRHTSTPSFYINKNDHANELSTPVPTTTNINASLESVSGLSTLDTSNNTNTANHNFSVHNQSNITQSHNNNNLLSYGAATTGANDMKSTPKSATLLKEMLSTWIDQRKLLNDSLTQRMQRLREQPTISLQSSNNTSPNNRSISSNTNNNIVNASHELLNKSNEFKQNIASPRFPLSNHNTGMFTSHSTHHTSTIT